VAESSEGESGPAVPKYLEISAALRDKFATMRVGTRLPPEREMAAAFGVSRMTLRQALDEVEAEGRIERVRGSGTYVRRPTVAMGPRLTSFTEDMERRGFKPSSRLLGFSREKARVEVTEALQIKPDDHVVRVERLRLADEEPICLEVSVFPSRLQRLLENGDVEQSIHALLKDSGITIASLSRRVRATAAAPRESVLLGLPDGSPVLEVVDVFHDSSGSPVQRARSRYRPDRYEVVSELNV
jgi:GntR family transcriptional regulator